MPKGIFADLPAFLPFNQNSLERVITLLRAGEVVALPTETVYGLAANALDERAVQKIFAIKGRPLLDPLIVHGPDVEFLSQFADFTPLALKLADACWPGPLTLVLPKKSVVTALVTAGRSTVAVRAPAHPVMRAVLEASAMPLAAPCANPFGYISPTRPEHVRASFGSRVPWIMDGGPCFLGLESTIVDVSDPAGPPKVLRLGPITPEALTQILGVQPILATASPDADEQGLPAPGMLSRHYSPRTPLTLLDAASHPAPSPQGRAAWIRLTRPAATTQPPAGVEVFWLSENGNIPQAARELYDLLRRLDEAGYERLWCDAAPATGLGLALNDRLGRAAGLGAGR